MEIAEKTKSREGRARGRPSKRTEVTPGEACRTTSRSPIHRRHSSASSPTQTKVESGGEGPSRGTLRGRREQDTENFVVHTRPEGVVTKTGISGQKVMLQSNYFKLRSVTDWILYQHRVDFTPREDRTAVKKAMVRAHKDVLGGYMFDGTVLYTSHRLTDTGEILELFSQRRDETKVQINIRFVGQLLSSDHHYIQFFNILMRKCLGALKLQLVGRNFYDAAAKVDIRQYRMELWPGYTTSIRQHEQDIMMCTEITHKVMRQDTVLDMMNCMMRQPNFQHMFKLAIVGLVVLTDYNNRTYRIDDVDFSVNPLFTFDKRDKTSTTYVKYYHERYQIRIHDMNQPLLVSRCKARDLRAGAPEVVYLIPELCRMTGLTDDMRSNFNLMRALAEHTRVGPEVRIKKLVQFSQRLMSVPEIVEDLSNWNMGLSSKLIQFQGRVLDPETILMGTRGNERQIPGKPQADWTHDLKNACMYDVANLQNWVMVCPEVMLRESKDFMEMVKRAGVNMGMTINSPYIHTIRDDRQGTYVNELEEVLSSFNPQIIVCFVTNNRGDRYGAIKKKCCVDRGVPSQVITQRIMKNRGVQSIASKIAIQINCKVGGAPWTIANNPFPKGGLMVVGFDVSHDTMNKGLSYGAIVASLNPSFSRYYSAVSSHKAGEELSNELSINMVKAIQKYRIHNNGALPSRIIVYRDGVGDGQIPYVHSHEIVQITDNLSKLYGESKFRMAFIIVSKRINTRIFTDKNENPKPGTVVDDVITLPERYDFFIVSQSVRQGTVSPTSYNVIFDTSGLRPDQIQRITYKMTHMYYNWSGTVRVPAPVQYAHKLAMLVGQSLHRSPHNDLDNLLYFL